MVIQWIHAYCVLRDVTWHNATGTSLACRKMSHRAMLCHLVIQDSVYSMVRPQASIQCLCVACWCSEFAPIVAGQPDDVFAPRARAESPVPGVRAPRKRAPWRAEMPRTQAQAPRRGPRTLPRRRSPRRARPRRARPRADAPARRLSPALPPWPGPVHGQLAGRERGPARRNLAPSRGADRPRPAAERATGCGVEQREEPAWPAGRARAGRGSGSRLASAPRSARSVSAHGCDEFAPSLRHLVSGHLHPRALHQNLVELVGGVHAEVQLFPRTYWLVKEQVDGLALVAPRIGCPS